MLVATQIAAAPRTAQPHATLDPADNAQLPSLDELLGAMNGDATTNRWDVVTSYAQDRLNSILKGQYQADRLLTSIEIDADGTDPMLGTTFKLTVRLKLGAPLLQFLAGESGKCVLTMPIEADSTYQVDANPAKSIPAVYDLECTVPLAALNGTTAEVAGAGELVSFGQTDTNTAVSRKPDAEPPEQWHIVLHFQNTADSTYQIKTRDGSTQPTDDFLKVYVVPKLAAYFKDNVQAIDYALTSLSNEQPTGDVVLKPLSFAFTSSAFGNSGSTADATNGILSLWIQTDVSGAPPGNLQPSFQPGGVEMFPVPKDHMASIIFAHDLIAKRYVQAQLERAGYTVTEIAGTTDGSLQFQIAIHQVITGDASKSSFWNKFQSDDVTASLGANPLVLTLKDGAVTVSWNYDQTLEWSDSTQGARTNTWGKVHLHIDLHKTVALTLDDEKFGADLAIARSDLNVSTSAESLSWTERSTGGSETLPRELEADKLSLDLPDISLDLGGLGFFPVTNLLFPGQQVITVDRATGLRTPRDLVLVGQIAETAAAGRAPGAAPAAKDTRALCNDIFTQDSVAASAFNTVATGDPDQLDAWLKQNNYQVSDEGFQHVLGSVHDVNNHDVSMWGGVYEISAPSDLAGQRLKISPGTGSVTLDEKDIALTTGEGDHLVWEYNGCTYDIRLSDHYKDDGESEPNTFSGVIKTPSGQGQYTEEDFQGKQVLYDKSQGAASGWWENERLTQAVLVISMLANLIQFVTGMWELRKRKLESAAVRRVEEAKEEERRRRLEILDAQEPDAKTWEPVRTKFTAEVEKATNDALNKLSSTDADQGTDAIFAKISGEMKAGLQPKFNKFVWEVVRNQICVDLGALQYFTNVDSLEGGMVEKYAKPKFDILSADGNFIDCKIRSVISKFRQVNLRRSAEVHQAVADTAKGSWDRTQQEIASLDTKYAQQSEIANDADRSNEDRENAKAAMKKLDEAIEAAQANAALDEAKRAAEQQASDEGYAAADQAKSDADGYGDKAQQYGDTTFGEGVS